MLFGKKQTRLRLFRVGRRTRPGIEVPLITSTLVDARAVALLKRDDVVIWVDIPECSEKDLALDGSARLPPLAVASAWNATVSQESGYTRINSY